MVTTAKGSSSSSGEDYLRAVYELSKTEVSVRSVDVARALNVSKPSVHRGLANLEQEGYLTQQSYGPVVLTQKGKIAGKKLQARYEATYRFLTEILGVSEERAAKEAHSMEHALSPSTTKKLTEFMKQKLDEQE